MLYRCSHCHQELPATAFSPSAIGHRDFTCRACKAAYGKAWAERNRDRVKVTGRERMRAWRERKFPRAMREQRKVVARVERFWRKVKKLDGCWLWVGSRNDSGYGQFGVTGYRNTGAHRFSWELANGPVPNGLHVLHKCDNPPCVRPDHLFIGSSRDNAIDKELKGRGNQPKGSRHPHAKLDEAAVTEILRIGNRKKQTDLAAEFNVTAPTIGKILRREAWRHVDV